MIDTGAMKEDAKVLYLYADLCHIHNSSGVSLRLLRGNAHNLNCYHVKLRVGF